MHQELPILVNITAALVVAFLGGLLARRIGLPTIVGYLFAGIALGPFTPGFIGDIDTIQQLAELGVIFLMLGVGLHFSFEDLWKVRRIAIPGALIQTLLATAIGFFLSQLWGWSFAASLVLGLAISVASTVVLLRGLMDNSLLNTLHGQTAVGWLVMEDILSVIILVFMPVFSGGNSIGWVPIGITLVKIAAFAALMILLGKRFIPWLLEKIAHTRSRELFILAILAITLGTALGSAELFGISLALGAFVAGAIISQSHLNHQIGVDIIPFRDSFAVLFFVSVGMLVNPPFLWENIWPTVELALLIIVGKLLITILIGTFFAEQIHTFLVVGVGLSQIGEFSFILGQQGVHLGMLSTDQYSLILAGALISISLNPFMYRLLPLLEKLITHLPLFMKKNTPLETIHIAIDEGMKNHLVLVGYGQAGQHLVDVLQQVETPLLVIDSDSEQIKSLNQRRIHALYGDAANSEILKFANLPQAALMVITVPDETAASTIITIARDINPDLNIISRASSLEGIQFLMKTGAKHIVYPELEGGLEIIYHSLLELGFPLREVHKYTEAIRHDRYDTSLSSREEYISLQELLNAAGNIDITWIKIPNGSLLVGKTILEANFRSVTGASIVALKRGEDVIANPKSMTEFEVGDQIGFIGDQTQIAEAVTLINTSISSNS